MSLKAIISAICFLLLKANMYCYGQNQKVGLVLSGGGAHGLTHVGVLQALEEHNIKVDYITGTSIGALVGAMYAAGFSPLEMRGLFTSEEYYKMSKGEIKDPYKYLQNLEDNRASLLSVHFSNDSIFKPVLPTNLINGAAIDLNLALNLAAAEAISGYNFDSLMIPFRCVASDIHAKKEVIFSSGSLSNAVRASMSYPFFIQPIKIDDKLLFDGGLYNNFPSDVMCDNFKPDFIIGSNVSANNPVPHEDDLITQIRTMLMNQSGFNINCAPSVMIEPGLTIGTFDFAKAAEVIEIGYRATLSKIDSIKSGVKTSHSTNLSLRRSEFNNRKTEVYISDVSIEGLSENRQFYAKKILARGLKKHKKLSTDEFQANYFRLYNDAAIHSVYPTLTSIDSTGNYIASVKTKRESNFTLDFGGNFASRPASHGYVGLTHNFLSKAALRTHGNSYFGRLYSGFHLDSRLTLPGKIPLAVEPHFTFHRFNYFQSRTTSLLVEERPGYMIMNELFGGLDISTPVLSKGILTAGINYFHLEDDYYQTRNFTRADTSDLSLQEGLQIKLRYEENNLNYNQFATKGNRLYFSVSYIDNREEQIPGTTNIFNKIRRHEHQWFLARFKWENYLLKNSRIRIGYEIEGAYSTQSLLSNYTASIARSQVFQPTVESKVLFLESFRAYQFAAGGVSLLYNLTDNISRHAEGYLFQPIREINRNSDNQMAVYGEYFERRYTIFSGSAVYQSPVGPLSLSVNYYHDNPDVALERQTPVTVFFNFGYILFNKRALSY